MTASRLSAVVFSLFLVFGAEAAVASPIQDNAVIDEASPLSGDRIEVENGLSGPTTVSIIEGGIAAGVIARQMSTIIVDGGSITLPSRLEDSTRMVVLGGSVACSDDSCLASDPAYLVRLTGASKLEVKGGFISAIKISLRDDSMAEFFGTDLSIDQVSTSEYSVTGALADGTPLSATVSLAGDPSGRVVLTLIPEPQSSVLVAVGLCFLGSSRLRSRS